jgi:hypothetical protein
MARGAHGVTVAAVLSAACNRGSHSSSDVPPLPVHATVAQDWAGAPARTPTPPPPAAPHTKPSWVLHVGDSFVDAAFQQNLRPRFLTAGARYLSDGLTSTYTTTWAEDPQLDRWLAARPDLVIVTLGANEADVSVPTAHARAIERIVRKIVAAGASCVWTTPPMWKADTGILQVIHDHSAPCLFFDSDAVLGGLTPQERRGDRIHPNVRGGSRWAEAFWMWLVDHRNLSRGPWVLEPFERRDA